MLGSLVRSPVPLWSQLSFLSICRNSIFPKLLYFSFSLGPNNVWLALYLLNNLDFTGFGKFGVLSLPLQCSPFLFFWGNLTVWAGIELPISHIPPVSDSWVQNQRPVPVVLASLQLLRAVRHAASAVWLPLTAFRRLSFGLLNICSHLGQFIQQSSWEAAD